MKCRIRCHILFGLLALLQFFCAYGKQTENDHALMLQTKVENLIEKILQVIEDYYHQIRTELKCIPDEVPDTIIGTLKKAIDCVDQNERTYDNGKITANAHKKAFLKCFSDAKAEVEETIITIDPNVDYCPENMTEKTYQINVTTTFTKTFHINIKNGLEILKKKVHLGNEEQTCVFHQGEHVSGKPNQTVPDSQPNNYPNGEDNNDADENKVNDLHSKEHHGKGHEPKEHHGKGHEPKEHHGKGHESKEHHGTDHHFSGHSNNGYESKDYYDWEKENLLEASGNPASAHGGNDSSNADKNVNQTVEQVSDVNGHASKGHHGTGHESKEILTHGHESKEVLNNDHKSKEHHGTGHESKEILTQGHESKEILTQGHESKEILTQGHESKEVLNNDHKSKEHHGTGHESKEILTQGHESKEVLNNDHKSKEHHGTGHESKEILTQGHESKEILTQGHESKEVPNNDHKSKEHHGKGYPSKGHESKENHDKDHDTKARPNEGNESKESSTQGHVTKEHPGKGHEPKEHHSKDQQPMENHTETVLGISNVGDEYGGNDSSNEDNVPYDTALEIGDNDNAESDSDLDYPVKEIPGHGGAINDDGDDDDEQEKEYSIADEYDQESDFSGTDEDENGGVNSAQDNDEESETGPESKGFHGKGHESKESFDNGTEQQPEDYEESQVGDYNNYDDDDDDDDKDEDTDFLEKGKENILNSITDFAAHDNETKNKTKDKNPSSGHGPITDNGGHNDLGTDHEKFSFPDTTAKFKLTTRPSSSLATESPTNKPLDEDYYADPDTEPEDPNYGNEYFDASEKQKSVAENPDQSLNRNPGQSKPNPAVASRIQVKPKNQFRHKPKKLPQNSERHKITLPKNWFKKPQPRIASRSMTSLSQSFLQSDF